MGQGYASGVVHPSPDPFPQGKGSVLALVSSDADFFEDRFDHAVGIGEDFVVPEADNAIAMRFDNLCSASVRAGGMLPSVAFHGKAQGPAGEVGDEVSDLVLARKLDAQLPRTQARPQPFLRIRRLSAQFARGAGQSLFCQRGTPIPNPFPQGKGLLVAKFI